MGKTSVEGTANIAKAPCFQCVDKLLKLFYQFPPEAARFQKNERLYEKIISILKYEQGKYEISFVEKTHKLPLLYRKTLKAYLIPCRKRINIFITFRLYHIP